MTRPGSTVPNLEKAALAYANSDESYFSGSQHYSDHLRISGFDKSTRKSLYVEAKKAGEEPHIHDKESAGNKNSHFGGQRDRVKLFSIRLIVQGLDGLCGVLRVLGIVRFFRV